MNEILIQSTCMAKIFFLLISATFYWYYGTEYLLKLWMNSCIVR